jgi:hypothetical protein
MDSLKVDEYSQVTPIVLSNAMMKLANPTTDGTIFNATTLNKLYTYLENSDQLHNGYMVLLLGSGFSISSLDNGDPIGFKGKALFVIEGSYDINSKWPNSKDSTNIQLICIRKGGELKSWGWLSGDFAGIFYWEHPPCKGINVNLSSPAPSKWWGGFLMGQHLPAGTPEPHFGYTPGNCPSGSPSYVQFNAGTTRLIKSDALYQDVGENLPGVLRPAQRSTTFNNEIINSTVKWAYFYKRSPLVRLVHDRPYFEPIGVFR